MSLINLRNALMAGKRLPYDAEVEYLESTGTQYIDTGVSGAEQNLIITAGVRINTFSAYLGGFGNYVSESANCYRLILTNVNDGQAYANCGYITSSSHQVQNFALNAWHTVVLNGAEDRCFCDGVEFTKPRRFVQGTANSNTIRVCTSGGPAAGTWSKQVSAFKVELNGVLVRDFIPVRKGTVGYLYDRVSGKLFGNAGTGDFVLGPDVVPVEYIESHRTECINTGVVPDSATKWDIDAQFQSNAYGQIMGRTGGSGSNPRFAFGLDIQTSGHGLTWYCGLGNLNTWNGTFDRSRHTFSLDAPKKTFAVDNTAYSVSYAAIDSTPTIRLFARIANTTMQNFCNARVFGSQIYNSGVQVRSFLPVRVGTGSTWQGAMMDVLTRRIYRNAGTGAFTYGNDLKYPIPSE